MNQATAQATVSAAISVGYNCQTTVDASNDWIVVVTPGKASLSLQDIAAFAQANGIVGTLQSVSLK